MPFLTLVCCLLLTLAAEESVRGDSIIAYTKAGVIYTASADGSHPRQVCRGSAPCISNDGHFLAYTRSVPPASKNGAYTRAIIVRELATGKETTLHAGGAEQVFGALWSPDDRLIAFNVLTSKSWQVAVSAPNDTGFRLLTDPLDTKKVGYYLAGWNLHDRAVLAQDLHVVVQVDPVSGEVAWQRPIKEITGEDSASSDWHCTISSDGKLAVSTRYVDADEFKNLDGPSSYLVLTDLPNGVPRRATPTKFDVATPWLDAAGESILLRGFGAADVTTVKGSDGVKLKTRVYRYDLRTGALKPLIQDADCPTASRDLPAVPR